MPEATAEAIMEGTAGSVLSGRQVGSVSKSRPHLSVSQLKMYLRCPLQYFFRYECGLKVPPTGDLALGRAIHETLNVNYSQKVKTKYDLILPHITELFSEHWEKEAEMTEFKNGEKPGKFKDDGVKLLKAYFEEIAPGVQPVEVEREFLIDTVGTRLPLKGYIDLLDDQDCIIDHKTTKRSYPENTAEKDIQLTAYSLAFRTLYGKEENGVRLDVMVRNKEPKIQQLNGTRTEDDISRFSRLAGQIENAIRSGVYYPNEGFMCGICGYQGMCEKW
jgi:RecB family exonuclease